MEFPNEQYNVLVSVIDAAIESAVVDKLKARGYVPRIVSYEDLYSLTPFYGPENEAIFIIYAGQDMERMHAAAAHLKARWATRGVVTLVAFHPGAPAENDVFRLWGIDTVDDWSGGANIMVIQRSATSGVEGADEVSRMISVIIRSARSD